jgi:RNA-directed DNA polymerase
VEELEQRSIEFALDYGYLIQTDITDCYGSIYTHSIAWAIHGKDVAKQEKQNKSLIGNIIDSDIQDISYGQTNGIPQGSVLMDFIAEILLGYADSELSGKIEDCAITDYHILRYRDDYRVFINNPQDGERIVKLLTKVMIDLGLKLNPST